MIDFEHSLCPIDFSDPSLCALTDAAAFASGREAQAEVLPVISSRRSPHEHSAVLRSTRGCRHDCQ